MTVVVVALVVIVKSNDLGWRTKQKKNEVILTCIQADWPVIVLTSLQALRQWEKGAL